MVSGKVFITTLKGHELMLYEALSVIVGPFFIFTIVKMDHNKRLNQKKIFIFDCE